MIPYLKDEEELDRELSDAKDKIVVVCFTTKSGSGDANTSMEATHNELKDVLFYKVDVEAVEASSLVIQYAPEALPCFIFYKKS